MSFMRKYLRNTIYLRTLASLSFLCRINLFKFCFLACFLIVASSFEMRNEKNETKIQSTHHEASKIQPIILPAKFPLKISNPHSEELSNTFLNFIPGLREYLFRFKRTDLKTTC